MFETRARKQMKKCVHTKKGLGERVPGHTKRLGQRVLKKYLSRGVEVGNKEIIQKEIAR